jgi:hypothetical protein
MVWRHLLRTFACVAMPYLLFVAAAVFLVVVVVVVEK